MRFLPIITAAIVGLILYAFVIQRDTLFALVGRTPTEEAAHDEATDIEAVEAEEALAADIDGAVRVMARHSIARDVESAVILRGETSAMREVVVMAETTGSVISEPLRSGAHLEAGQDICSIDPGVTEARLALARAQFAEIQARRPETEARIPEAEAQLIGAQAALEEAEINANTAKELSQRGFSSTTTLAGRNSAVAAASAQVVSAQAGVKAAKAGIEALDALLESAQSALAEAEKEIDKLTIKAPFAGLIEDDTAELGSLLQPGTTCATILQLNPIKVIGFVPEVDVARVTLGAPSHARMTDGQEVQGEVSFISRSADSSTRTFRVELLVDNESLSIRQGQTAEIAISTEGRKAHLLPQSTLTLNNDGTLGVRVVAADSTALFVPVTIMRDTQEGVWLDGLPEESDIIILGQEYVTDGVPVIPSYEEITQ